MMPFVDRGMRMMPPVDGGNANDGLYDVCYQFILYKWYWYCMIAFPYY